MNIAVTAASGRLGHATLRALSQASGLDKIVAIARDSQRIDVSGVEKRGGDYQSIDDMATALSGIDTVVMISAPVVPGTDRIELHRNVVAAACQAAIRKIIFTSVIGSTGEEDTMFAATQQVNRQTEKDIKACGLEWIVARNGLYLDLDLGHILRANDAGVYQNNGGDGRCGYVSIEEIAFALAQLARSDACNGRVVNLTSENLTQAELVALANEVFGLNVRYEGISVEQNVKRFMADERIAARGPEVAQMLSGCFQCIERGAFDVSSDFSIAAGRPPKSIQEQFERIREQGRP
jgi:NAD(P)H dehydrogenase (quinone)